MKEFIKRLFLNEKAILVVIIINSAAIFLQESFEDLHFIDYIDVICTFIFIIEMIVKISSFGFRQYWSEGWNRMDFILVMMSLPSVVALFWPSAFEELGLFLILRLFRVFRFFRAVHIFPDFATIAQKFWVAMHKTLGIFFGYFIMIITFALICSCFLKESVPEFFSTPSQSIYSIFRLCTGEGWYEIPDAVTSVTTPFWGHLMRVFFCLMLIGGGIIGLSLINSIFVDTMVSDNNDDLKEQICSLEEKIDKLEKLLESKSDKL